MNKFSISEAFKYGLTKTRESFIPSTTVLLTYAVVSIVFGNFAQITETDKLINIFGFFLTLLIGTILRIGITKYYLDITEGYKPRYLDLFSDQDLFFPYFAAYVILIALIVVGTSLFIIPGIFVITTFVFVPILIIDKDLDVIESFKVSARITEGSRLRILWALLAAVGINIIGAACVVVGLLVTLPVTFFAGIFIYRKLLGEEITIPNPLPEESIESSQE
jgi:uncharacterized membrane protein